MRRFSWAPKHMFQLMDKKIIAILRKLFLLNWPYGDKENMSYYDVTFSAYRSTVLRFCELKGWLEIKRRKQTMIALSL